MIHTLAISNYRSLLNLVIPLSHLNVVTGPNGCGKSNLYKAIRLLSETASGGVVNALAQEGGLQSAFWAGPEKITDQMRSGEVAVEGTGKHSPHRLRMGFAGEDFSYSISLGLPRPTISDTQLPSKFSLDPEIKKEVIWAGTSYRPANSLVDRTNAIVKYREQRSWQPFPHHLSTFDSMLSEMSDPIHTPEILKVKSTIRSWRFYDHFRTDKDAQTRQTQIGTRTPVLDHDGHTLAAALQTIIEVGDKSGLEEAIDDAFPGSKLSISVDDKSRFSLEFYQYGLLRPLTAAELSDGTLRYLLLVAALLTPRPPSLMVLNEPETSLHPDLLPALAKLIIKVSERTQVWVVTHANRLVNALEQEPDCNSIILEKELGQTKVLGQGLLNTPSWKWPD